MLALIPDQYQTPEADWTALAFRSDAVQSLLDPDRSISYRIRHPGNSLRRVTMT
jgi:hypothetical protein